MDYNYDEISASEAERLSRLNAWDYWPGRADYEPDEWFYGSTPWDEGETEFETEFGIQ